MNNFFYKKHIDFHIMETTRDCETYLNIFGLIIKKHESPPDNNKMIFIRYSIIDKNYNIEALLDLWVCREDLDKSISKLKPIYRKQFNKIKKIVDEPMYCSTVWVNGSKKYKNLGKLIMYYMLLDCQEKYKLFINKLDNASGSKETYKLFGFHVVEELGEEEIMVSVTLENIKKNINRIRIIKKEDK